MRIAGLLWAFALLSACAPAAKPWTPQGLVVGIANPASVDCGRKGGETQIIDTPGGQVGVCAFSDGRRCEEWALFRDNRCVAAQAPGTGSRTSGKTGG